MLCTNNLWTSAKNTDNFFLWNISDTWHDIRESISMSFSSFFFYIKNVCRRKSDVTWFLGKNFWEIFLSWKFMSSLERLWVWSVECIKEEITFLHDSIRFDRSLRLLSMNVSHVQYQSYIRCELRVARNCKCKHKNLSERRMNASST